MAEKIASQILAIVLVKTLGSLMEAATGRHPARPGGLPRDCCRILERALCLLEKMDLGMIYHILYTCKVSHLCEFSCVL